MIRSALLRIPFAAATLSLIFVVFQNCAPQGGPNVRGGSSSQSSRLASDGTGSGPETGHGLGAGTGIGGQQFTQADDVVCTQPGPKDDYVLRMLPPNGGSGKPSSCSVSFEFSRDIDDEERNFQTAWTPKNNYHYTFNNDETGRTTFTVFNLRGEKMQQQFLDDCQWLAVEKYKEKCDGAIIQRRFFGENFRISLEGFVSINSPYLDSNNGTRVGSTSRGGNTGMSILFNQHPNTLSEHPYLPCGRPGSDSYERSVQELKDLFRPSEIRFKD